MKNITCEHLLILLHEFKYSVNTWIWNVLRYVTNKNTINYPSWLKWLSFYF